MSRIGRLPIKIADGVTVTEKEGLVTVKGRLGELKQVIENADIKVEVINGEVHVTRANDLKQTKAAHGLYRVLIANMIEGVTKGFTKVLTVNGVGFKASVIGKMLTLNVGYSHPVTIEAPYGIAFAVNNLTEITVSGIDKCLVGQVAANIKAVRKPDPYHAYGVAYKGEVLVRKVGKKAGK